MSEHRMRVWMDTGLHVQQKRPSVENQCLRCEKWLMGFLTFYFALISFSEFKYFYAKQEGWKWPYSLRVLMKSDGIFHLHTNTHSKHSSPLTWFQFLTTAWLVVGKDGSVTLEAASLRSGGWQTEFSKGLTSISKVTWCYCISWRWGSVFSCWRRARAGSGGERAGCRVDSHRNHISFRKKSLKLIPYLRHNHFYVHTCNLWSGQCLSTVVTYTQFTARETLDEVVTWLAWGYCI